jgi:excinuclease ABC subunit B
VKKSIGDIMNSVYERDHVLVEIGDGGMADDVISIGHNFEAVLSDLETTHARSRRRPEFRGSRSLRDEVKRLRATELAVVDDPTVKQKAVAGRAGAYAGTKKYGEAANLPVSAMKNKKREDGAQGGREIRLKGAQAASRRNARPGIAALPPQRHPARKTVRQHQPHHPADRLAGSPARSSDRARGRAAARPGRRGGWKKR